EEGIGVRTVTGVQTCALPILVRITALRNDLVRVRVSPNSVLPEDASWAVLPEARTKSIDVQPSQDASSVGFRTASLDVRVERDKSEERRVGKEGWCGGTQ